MTSAYRGRNRYRTFLKAGRTIAGRIAALDGTVGVLGTGAIGRRFGDRFSDLDLVVYARTDAVRAISRLVSVGWIRYRGMDFDIVVESYERACKAGSPSIYRSQVRRWDVQNSQILHDTDDRVKDLLQAKLVYPDSERRSMMARYQQEVHEYLVFFPELWAERGQLYNVVDALHRAVQSMVLWIYAKNKVFEPYIPKWLFWHCETETVPEHVYLTRLTEIHTTGLRSIAAAMRAREKLLRVCEEIGLTFEVNGFDEARVRALRNWKRTDDATRRILAW